jgi:hypothetical protein
MDSHNHHMLVTRTFLNEDVRWLAIARINKMNEIITGQTPGRVGSNWNWLTQKWSRFHFIRGFFFGGRTPNRHLK